MTNIKRLIDSNTVIAGNFNTPLPSMDRSSKQKINKETMALNDTLDQMNLKDLFITFHPKKQKTRSSLVHMEHSPEQIMH